MRFFLRELAVPSFTSLNKKLNVQGERTGLAAWFQQILWISEYLKEKFASLSSSFNELKNHFSRIVLQEKGLVDKFCDPALEFIGSEVPC